MSYADMAAKGPKQSNAEKMPQAVPEIEHADSDVRSIDSSISTTASTISMPSYADQQLASERAEERRDAEEDFADEMAIAAREFEEHAEAELARLEQESGTKYSDFSGEARQKYESWKSSAQREFHSLKKNAKPKAEQAKRKAREAERWTEKNKDHPVVVGNFVTLAAIGGLLGFGAYRMHQQGTLTAKVVGLWVGALGLFAVGDYYVSNLLFKKYPPKK